MSNKMNGIEEIPAIANYINRVLSKYENISWDNLNGVRAWEWDDSGKYQDTRVRIKFPMTEKQKIRVSGDEWESALPTEDETTQIVAALSIYKWPDFLFGNNFKEYECPWKDGFEDKFEFLNEDGFPVMVQFMKRRKSGLKDFAPITKWSDGFRRSYPTGSYPLYNIHLIKERKAKVVGLHEGAKAARAAQEIADGKKPNHPWAKDFMHPDMVHVGWIGGALSPNLTDFSILKKLGIEKVYIFPDNDAPGKEAVPEIARQIDLDVFMISLTGFGPAFDMANDFPAEFFKKGMYIGPRFIERRSCITWADTKKVIPPKDGREKEKIEYSFRKNFLKDWYIAENDGILVNVHEPSQVYEIEQAKRKLEKLSHNPKVADMLSYSIPFGQRVKLIDMWPGKDRVFNDNKKGDLFNAWSRPNIAKDRPGDLRLWNQLLNHLIPKKEEREYFKKWLYTMIARPEIRIGWGVLLQSGNTGVGKGTVANVLANLVGIENTSFPSYKDVGTDFNGWVAFKKLAIFHEFYGVNADDLKTCMTDEYVSYNEKFKVPKMIRCFIEILACSNSEIPIKLDSKDRRWFVPDVTEVALPHEFWSEFNNWIHAGGLEAINYEAFTYGDYFEGGERPMKTEKHGRIANGSDTPIRAKLKEFHETWKDENCWIDPKTLDSFLTEKLRRQEGDTPILNTRFLTELGWIKKEKGAKGVKDQRAKDDRTGNPVTALLSPATKELGADEMIDLSFYANLKRLDHETLQVY